MATALVPSREVLKADDDRAWKAYELICWDPNATSEERAEVFQKALVTMSTLIAFDRTVQLTT